MVGSHELTLPELVNEFARPYDPQFEIFYKFMCFDERTHVIRAFRWIFRKTQ